MTCVPKDTPPSPKTGQRQASRAWAGGAIVNLIFIRANVERPLLS